MDWPHDPDGEAGSEGGRKYGLAIFAKHIDDEDLPMSAADLHERFDDDPIRIDHEQVIAGADILAHLDASGPWETREELLGALGRAMRAGGYWSFETEQYQRG